MSPRGVKKPETLIQVIEDYLASVAKAIPHVRDTTLLDALTPILHQNDRNSELLRRALGFPTQATLSRSLLKLLRSSEPSLSSLIRVCAQRIHQLLWRFKYTLQNIDEVWTDEELPKIAAFSNLCQPYLLSHRPNLGDLQAALNQDTLSLKTDLKRFSESSADPILFAVLRAFEYDKEELQLLTPNPSRQEAQKAALDFMYLYLTQLTSGLLRVDDSSNAWWALRLGIESGEGRFTDMLARVIQTFPEVTVPSAEAKAASVVPEIYTHLRSSAYSLSSIQSILESSPNLSSEISAQLDVMIYGLARPLLEVPFSHNLYLASVHYEGLRSFLDYSEGKIMLPAIRSGKLKIADFCPIGKFTCVDPALKADITAVRKWLGASKTKKKRLCILVYGASSTGKTFLVEQFFREFQQEHRFSEGRIVCSRELDIVESLSKTLKGASSKPQAEGVPPFVYIDEADVERDTSIFPVLLQLVEAGNLEGPGIPANELVLFWGGGKHGSVESLKAFLTDRQTSPQYEKGLDLFNRSSMKMNLPITLLRNKNLKVLMGISEILNQHGSPVKFDLGIVKALREIPMAYAQGARTFEQFVNGLAIDDGVVYKPDLKRSGISVEAMI